MRKITVLGLCLLLLLAGIVVAAGKVCSVAGEVINQKENPIPGLTVYLVHPVVGRSNPVITDNVGTFSFKKVPFEGTPYFLEIYWGKELIYRKEVLVTKDVSLGKVKLN